jgi:anti-sigma factor RsiW
MTSTSPPSRDDAVPLLHAYLDGELDPMNALEIERRLAADPRLSAERDRVETLRRLIRERLPREMPSPDLYARIEHTIGFRESASRPSWRALAASIALTAIIASSSTWLITTQNNSASVENAVVAAHIRGLMATQPYDVASSDSHTVKPWFNGRIPESPRVVDLAKAGFPLAGGRIDVIDRNPVATLVYHRRQHVISVTATTFSEGTKGAPSHLTSAGYNIVTWVQNGVTYWVVSDLNSAELEDFTKLFRAAS